MPNLHKMLRSFPFALKGVRALFRHENNAQIHLIAALLALTAGAVLALSPVEWCILVIQIAFVWTAEAFNTAIEKLCDRVSPEFHPLTGTVKDLAAGAVLLAAGSSLVTGSILFLPKLFQLF